MENNTQHVKHGPTRLLRYVALSLFLAVIGIAVLLQIPVHAEEVVDEIHYSYHEGADKIVFHWRGNATLIEYGPTTDYGMQAVAVNSAVTPVDMSGPFREVILTGLQANSTYHYRIGGGPDHTFMTRPTGSFTWADVGDTGTTLCSPWVSRIHDLIAAQQPRFVTHGGDISYANYCGVPAVHRYYTDQEKWSHNAAFQLVLGNHEYGNPSADAPAGTPRDSLLNYKGRSYVTNSQIVPNDKTTQVKNPGCGWETGSTTNTCRGEDWGWFRAGKVLFISYPEPWPGAMADWQTKADVFMASAQADAGTDFIVTYGHRPAYSTVTVQLDAGTKTALDALAQKYSPAAGRPNGKYVLNLAHHVHGEEVFSPVHGLTHITNGGGGEGQVSYGTPAANSVYRTVHPAILTGAYDETARTLRVSILCGPDFTPNPKELCTYGSTLYTKTFQAGGTTPSPTVTEWVGNPSVESGMTGWTGKYGASPYVSVTRSTASGAHSGTAAIKVAGLTGARNLTSGFNDNPRWMQSAVAGKTYTASVWIKPQKTGQTMTLRVREWSGTTSVSDKKVDMLSTNTNWQQLTLPVTAARSGSQLSFAVYGSGIDAGEYFLADDLSLTSPN